MKYYSELTKKLYDTPGDLKADEKVFLEKQKAKKKEQEEYQLNRKEAAKVVETATEDVRKAYKKLQEKQENLRKVKKEFLDKYGVYHYTTTDPDDPAFDFVREAVRDMNAFVTAFNPFNRW